MVSSHDDLAAAAADNAETVVAGRNVVTLPVVAVVVVVCSVCVVSAGPIH